jgi:phosphoglycerate dehydrogenase-like enzyme
VGFKIVFLPPQSDLTRSCAADIAVSLPAVAVRMPDERDAAADELPDADAVFGTLSPGLLARCRNLRWLQAPAANPPAGYFFPELIAHPVTVTNFRGSFNDHVATHAFAFVLALARGLHVYLPQQVRREWRTAAPEHGVVHLPEATALVIGYGGIGAEVGRMCAALGMRVAGLDHRATSAPDSEVIVEKPEMLDARLPWADFVISTVPHTPETEAQMNRARFQAMKPTAYFVNVGRGQTVVQPDLVAALQAGEIAGCGLDVFEDEPIPADDPLWTAPNTLLTPHVAVQGPYVLDRERAIVLENARRFDTGAELVNVVDKAQWF